MASVDSAASVTVISPRPAVVPWGALSVVMIGTFMAILDVFIVLVAAPTIQDGLHATDAATQFVLAGYQLTYAVTLITAGRLGDLFGRKRLFMIGMAVFTVTSLVCGAAPNALALILARLVQGVGAALMFPQVFAMINVLVPERQRPRAFGVLGAVIGLSTIVGQVLGGLLIQADLAGTSWRPVFWINVPIGLAALLLAAWRVPESDSRQVRDFDLAGVAVLTVAVFLLVVPLIEGRQAEWPPWVWGCLGACVIAFGAFIATEKHVQSRGRAPLVPLALFDQRPFVAGLGLVVALYAALNSFFFVLSLTLQGGLGLSALDAGLVYAPQAVAFFGCSLIAVPLTRRYGRAALVTGAVITVAGFVATVLVALADDAAVIALIPTLVGQGIGQGLLLTPLLNQILTRVNADDVGAASGVLSTAQQIGGALGVALVGVVYYAALGHPSGPSPAHSHAHALGLAVLVNLVLTVIVAALLFALPNSRSRPV